MFRIVAVSALVAGLPLASLAEPLNFGPGLTLEGRVGLQFAHVSGQDTQFLGTTDLSLVWQGVSLGGVQLGAELALNGVYNYDRGTQLHNLWAAGVLDFGSLQVKAGAPRPVIEAMSPMRDMLSNAALELAFGRSLGSGASVLSLQDNGMTPGLAVTGQGAGGLAWGASAHRIDGAGKTVEAAQIAVNYTTGSTTVFGSAEHLWGDTTVDDSLQLGVLYDAGGWRLGLAAARADAVADGTVARLHVGYDLTPSLTLNSTYIHTGDGSLSSIDAEYSLPIGGFARAGAAVSGGDEIYDLTFGMKF